MMETISLIASMVLPMFNIPLIMRVVRRKSSSDISLTWVWGVWTCMLLMAPSGLTSSDLVWRTFSISNLIFFTVVAIIVTIYRKKTKNEKNIS